MRALALFSGGLDSLLSIYLIRQQNIEVTALHFNIGFGGKGDKSEYLKNALAQVGASLEIVDIREQFFKEVLFSPQYGYGKYFNPCIDCHANMFSHALRLLEPMGASFVISGEVLGQRPKSQRREALDLVTKLCGAEGLVLRPMSAKLLAPTIPEKEGWVDRERLLDISGRSRDRQLQMIKELGFKYYENPGGGCLLTDISIANRLKDLKRHREVIFEDMNMVKFGRYFILPDGARCVIGRNEVENSRLNAEHPQMSKIKLLDCVGPLGLVEKDASLQDKHLAIALTLLYGKSEPDREYSVSFENQEIRQKPFHSKEEAKRFLLSSG